MAQLTFTILTRHPLSRRDLLRAIRAQINDRIPHMDEAIEGWGGGSDWFDGKFIASRIEYDKDEQGHLAGTEDNHATHVFGDTIH